MDEICLDLDGIGNNLYNYSYKGKLSRRDILNIKRRLKYYAVIEYEGSPSYINIWLKRLIEEDFTKDLFYPSYVNFDGRLLCPINKYNLVRADISNFRKGIFYLTIEIDDHLFSNSVMLRGVNENIRIRMRPVNIKEYILKKFKDVKLSSSGSTVPTLYIEKE